MQRTAIAALCALLAGCASQPALTDYTVNSGAQRSPAQQALSFDHADLGLRIDPASRSLRGDATLTFGTRVPLASIELDLDRNLPIDAIAVDGRPLAASQWRNPDGKLTIALPQRLEPGRQVKIRITYHGEPHVAKRAPWDGGFVWARTPDGRPWVASAVEGEGCDLFWPCIDHPMGKPKVVDEHITVPAPLVAAGNGTALGVTEENGWRTWHWRAKHPSTYGIAINVGPYEVLSGEYHSRYGNVIPLRLWYLPQNKANAQALFAEFPPMLDFFESTIGPYPFADEKMGVVETPHKGMEHQTINAYGNKYVKTPYGYDDLLQHEFAHEWFGNQLTNADWDDMWLHEGLGSYMQPLYMQYLHGDQEYFAALLQQRANIRNKAPLVSGKHKREEDVYALERGGPGGDIYNKGSLVLHTLRGLIGDDAFFRAVRELVYGTQDPRPGNFSPRYATTPDFIAIVNRASGRDLGWFFQAYMYQAALPELVARRHGDTLDLTWKTAGKTPFPMPLDVRVGDMRVGDMRVGDMRVGDMRVGDERVGERIVTLPMTDGHGSIALPAHATYTLDPHSKILRREQRFEVYQRYQAQLRKAKS